MTDFASGKRFWTFAGASHVSDTVARLFAALAADDESLPYLRMISAHSLQGVSLSGEYSLKEDPDNYDYVYSLLSLSAMSGDRYRAHRNFLHRFKRTYNWEIRQLDLHSRRDWSQIKDVFVKWSGKKGHEGLSLLIDETALGRLPDLIDRIPFAGFGVYIDRILRGYSINELQGDGYSTNLFEHADTDYIGIFRILKQEVATRLLALGYSFWNHQQDGGLPGLRQSKASFLPAFLLKKFQIHARNGRLCP